MRAHVRLQRTGPRVRLPADTTQVDLMVVHGLRGRTRCYATARATQIHRVEAVETRHTLVVLGWRHPGGLEVVEALLVEGAGAAQLSGEGVGRTMRVALGLGVRRILRLHVQVL